MKTRNYFFLILCSMFVAFNSSAQSYGCNGDIDSYINIADEPGTSPNLHFMWGQAVQSLAIKYDCNDDMENYGGNALPMHVYLKTVAATNEIEISSTQNIGGTSYNLFHGNLESGMQGNSAMMSKWIAIDAVTEVVKQNYPYLIDFAGKYMIDVYVPISNGNTTHYHCRIIVWTDFRVQRAGDLEACEGESVDFNTLYTEYPPLSNKSLIPSSNWILQSGTTYTAGNIGTNLMSPETFYLDGTYDIANETNYNNQEYPHAGLLKNCFYLFNGGNWTLASYFKQKRLYVEKTFNMPIYNVPSATQTTSYPGPIYNNDPLVTLNNYWNMSGYTSYAFSGGGIAFNNLNNTYTFNPNVGQGSHEIELILDNGGHCSSTFTTYISVLNYPGIPGKPLLRYAQSFDYTTDSAWSNAVFVPPIIIPDDGVIPAYQDDAYYFRHKWLCPNVAEDSMQLFLVVNPNLIYYWKRSVNGLEEDLGTGTSKWIPRAHPTAPNEGDTYVEYVYFRAKNIVNNYSSWEYVKLEYPIVPYTTNSPNDSSSYMLIDTVCHNGSDNYAITNNLLDDETFMNMTNTNVNAISGNSQLTRKYVYSYWNDTLTSDNSGLYPYTWSGQKTDTLTIQERGYIKRPTISYYEDYDWCNCASRTLKVIEVKKPDITSISIGTDTTIIGNTNTLSVNYQFGNYSTWYVDSIDPGYLGDNVTFYPIGSDQSHDVYYTLYDNFGCWVDTMITDAFYVKSVGFVTPPSDTVTGTPIPLNPNACIDITDGGNVIVTPNNDGVNDYVYVCNNNRDYTISIIDRWGNVVLEKENESMIYVDGLKTSTYFYRLTTSDKVLSGFIEIKN